MARLLVCCLLMLAGLFAFADNKTGVVDSSDNSLSIQVLKSKDVKRIPIQISMDNPSVPMTCIQCYIQVSDTAATFCKDDKGLSYICSRTERWTAQHHTIPMFDTKKHPGAFMAIVVSPASDNFIGNSGPVLIVYLDGSALADGEYTVRMFDSNMVWTDKSAIRSYLTPDSEDSFCIENGELVVGKNRKEVEVTQ